MTSVMPKALPCIRCKTKMVKTGGDTGMCIACREADPELAAVQRANAKLIREETHNWVMKNSVPVPGQPHLRRMTLFDKPSRKARVR